MNLNFILSILVHKEILTEQEAEHLAQRLTTTIHSQNFKDAHRIVEKIFDELESKIKKHLAL